MSNQGSKPLTGRKVLGITVAAFSVVIAVNLVMAFKATETFPGLVVKNSYVAGQGWNERADAQRALGWQAEVSYRDGQIGVAMTDVDGAAIEGLSVSASVGRPATDREDQMLVLRAGTDRYAAPVALEPGIWRVAIEAKDRTGRSYRAEAEVTVLSGSAS